MEASKPPYKVAFAQQREPELPEIIANDVESWVKLSLPSGQVITWNKVASRINSVRHSYGGSWRSMSMAASLVACFVLGYGVASNKFEPDIEGVQRVADSQATWVNRIAEYQSLGYC